MIPDIDYLSVYIGDSRVGRLAMSKERISVFEYDSSWVRTGYSISPFNLPLESGLFTSQRDPFDGLFVKKCMKPHLI